MDNSHMCISVTQLSRAFSTIRSLMIVFAKSVCNISETPDLSIGLT